MRFEKKPVWLNKKISMSDCAEMKNFLRNERLNTVCEEAQCPNIGECFARRQATFIILGSVCTRGCAFCGVNKGTPESVDNDEALRIAGAVKEFALTHVVITSVTRDDIHDGGASHFAATVHAIHVISPKTIVETLIPDFGGSEESLSLLVGSKPDIVAHNVETVPRLYSEVRRGASYERSLNVLKALNGLCPRTPLKSGLMLGLGENKSEVISVFKDLSECGCSYLSIGQYLKPSAKHAPVKEYLRPELFAEYREEALKFGFKYVKSGPYVRSSYEASDYLEDPDTDTMKAFVT